MAKGTTLFQGMRPTIAWQRAMAGFIHTPPKMNRHTLMPNDQVVIANMWPESRYLLPLSVISQCTPTPKTIMRAVEAKIPGARLLALRVWTVVGAIAIGAALLDVLGVLAPVIEFLAVGSLIGPYTSRFFSDIWLKRLFIVLALYVGTDYVLRGFFNYRIFG